MPYEPTPSDDEMEEASALSTAIFDRLAAFDYRFAGHSSGATDAASLGSKASTADEAVDGPALNPAIDTLLLLRQVAAAERDSS